MKPILRRIGTAVLSVAIPAYIANYHGQNIESVVSGFSSHWLETILAFAIVFAFLLVAYPKTIEAYWKLISFWSRQCIFVVWLGTFGALSYISYSSALKSEWMFPLLIFLIFLFWTFVIYIGAIWNHFISPSKADTSLRKDLLHRQHIVDNLYKSLIKKDSPHRRIVILGEWGIGKTDVLKRLQYKFENSTDREFLVSFINPWREPTQDKALLALMKGVDVALGFPKIETKWLSSLVGSLLSAIGAPSPAKTLVKALAQTDTKAAIAKIKAVDEQLEKLDKKVIVMVDDMERVQKEALKRVFPAIDQLVALKHCTFIFAIDTDRVAGAYKDAEEAKGYLDKVFDLQLPLPQINSMEARSLALHHVDKSDFPFLHSSLLKIDRHIFPKNPRQILKWVNLSKSIEEIYLKNFYDYDQHDFKTFFLFRMLECESTKLMKFLGSHIELFEELIKAKRSTLVSLGGSFDDSETDEQNFQNKIKELCKQLNRNLTHQEVDILDALLLSVGRSSFQNKTSLEWAIFDYVALRGLSLKFYTKTYEFISENPKQTIKSALQESFAGVDHADLDNAESLFMKRLVKENLITSIEKHADSSKAETSAVNYTKFLTTYIYLHPSDAFANHYGKLFDAWLETHTDIHNNPNTLLENESIKLTERWVSILPLEHVRGLFNVITTIHPPYRRNEDSYKSSSLHKATVQAIHFRVFSDIIETMKKDNFSDRWFDEGFDNMTFNQFLSYIYNIDKKGVFLDLLKDNKDQLSLSCQKEIISTYLGVSLANYDGDAESFFEGLKEHNQDYIDALNLSNILDNNHEILEHYKYSVKARFTELQENSEAYKWLKNQIGEASYNTVINAKIQSDQ